MDKRFTEMTTWLAQNTGHSNATPKPASADASFRRYFRIDGETSRIVMDAPPPQEDCRPFVEIAGFMEAMGLNSPRVLDADLERGFLLLSDLGSVQYLHDLDAHPLHADRLYNDALSALLRMQREGKVFQSKLPTYDRKMLLFELSLFHDWLCEKHLKISFSAADEKAWVACCNVIVDNALQQQQVFVHRDYHSRNLMLTPQNNPGILDFQDAVEGPLTYDLVSLLKDCYVKWPAEKIKTWALTFYAQLPQDVRSSLTESDFIRQFDLTGVQRHLKAAGIFARLLQRDGKPGYMKDVPRTLSYVVDIAPDYDYKELSFLSDLISGRVLPALRDEVS
jgi:aminoglycoside/choline kinase family phosphotransferase